MKTKQIWALPGFGGSGLVRSGLVRIVLVGLGLFGLVLTGLGLSGCGSSRAQRNRPVVFPVRHSPDDTPPRPMSPEAFPAEYDKIGDCSQL